MKTKERFFQIYANLPLNFRKEIIAVVDNEPVSWNSAKLEIENNSKIGKKNLELLKKMEIIT